MKDHQYGVERKTLRAIQIADPHLDDYYLEGSVGNCESGLCCRAESQPKKDGTPVEPAGRWGR